MTGLLLLLGAVTCLLAGMACGALLMTMEHDEDDMGRFLETLRKLQQPTS